MSFRYYIPTREPGQLKPIEQLRKWLMANHHRMVPTFLTTSLDNLASPSFSTHISALANRCRLPARFIARLFDNSWQTWSTLKSISSALHFPDSFYSWKRLCVCNKHRCSLMILFSRAASHVWHTVHCRIAKTVSYCKF